MYHLDDDAVTVTWYTPDGMLYDALGDCSLEWCGPANRHGRHCLLELKPVYPSQDVFQKLRTLARRFDFPVLLVYGRPDIVPTESRMNYGNLSYSQGSMGILFRPGDGRTCRVHFNQTDTGGTGVRVLIGEPGEFGPLHPQVVAGIKQIQQQ